MRPFDVLARLVPAAILAFALVAPAGATAPYLVKDVNDGVAEYWSITHIQPLGARIIVRIGTSGVDGSLWGTDGTPAGNELLTPGRFRASLLPDVAGRAVFTTTAEGVLELWSTDGTLTGTMRLTSLLELRDEEEDEGISARV